MQNNNMVAASQTACRSYDEAHGVLDTAFSGRGLLGSMISESAALDRSIACARLDYPSAFTFADAMRNDSRNRYRTGVDRDGNAYMTFDDLKRLAVDEERRYARADSAMRALAGVSRELSAAEADDRVRPACPYAICDGYSAGLRAAGRRESVITGRTETEMRLSEPRRKGLISRLSDMLYNRLGNEAVVGSGFSPRHVSGAVAAVSLILVFALVLAMPILMSVLIHEEATEVRILESELAEKEKVAAQLRTDLDAKNDRFMLEKLAREEYGMIPVDRSAFRILSISPADSVSVVEASRSEGAVPALLSALGLRKGDD